MCWIRCLRPGRHRRSRESRARPSSHGVRRQPRWAAQHRDGPGEVREVIHNGPRRRVIKTPTRAARARARHGRVTPPARQRKCRHGDGVARAGAAGDVHAWGPGLRTALMAGWILEPAANLDEDLASARMAARATSSCTLTVYVTTDREPPPCARGGGQHTHNLPDQEGARPAAHRRGHDAGGHGHRERRRAAVLVSGRPRSGASRRHPVGGAVPGPRARARDAREGTAGRPCSGGWQPAGRRDAAPRRGADRAGDQGRRDVRRSACAARQGRLTPFPPSPRLGVGEHSQRREEGFHGEGTRVR